MNSLVEEFIAQCSSRIEENTHKILRCVAEMDEKEIWMRPNKSSNSTANIILHLCGNIRQYIISGLGDQPDTRERDKEFAATGNYNKKDLVDKLTHTLQQAISIIQATNESQLLKIHAVQGFELSGMGIIIHVTEHYSYHTGQVISWTKQLKDKDLGFYSNVDLNKKNK
jgi:uncharacterized damage-inducible protein DinB